MSGNKYITLNINFEEAIQGKPLKRVSLEDSIAQHLHLIITTHLGENAYEQNYGCSIWEFDFDNTLTDSRLKDRIKESLIESIALQEKRIGAVDVRVTIAQSEIDSLLDSKRIKKRVDIHITSTIKETGETIKYYEYFFLGPLSYY